MSKEAITTIEDVKQAIEAQLQRLRAERNNLFARGLADNQCKIQILLNFLLALEDASHYPKADTLSALVTQFLNDQSKYSVNIRDYELRRDNDADGTVSQPPGSYFAISEKDSDIYYPRCDVASTNKEQPILLLPKKSVFHEKVIDLNNLPIEEDLANGIHIAEKNGHFYAYIKHPNGSCKHFALRSIPLKYNLELARKFRQNTVALPADQEQLQQLIINHIAPAKKLYDAHTALKRFIKTGSELLTPTEELSIKQLMGHVSTQTVLQKQRGHTRSEIDQLFEDLKTAKASGNTAIALQRRAATFPKTDENTFRMTALPNTSSIPKETGIYYDNPNNSGPQLYIRFPSGECRTIDLTAFAQDLEARRPLLAQCIRTVADKISGAANNAESLDLTQAEFKAVTHIVVSHVVKFGDSLSDAGRLDEKKLLGLSMYDFCGLGLKSGTHSRFANALVSTDHFITSYLEKAAKAEYVDQYLYKHKAMPTQDDIIEHVKAATNSIDTSDNHGISDFIANYSEGGATAANWAWQWVNDLIRWITRLVVSCLHDEMRWFLRDEIASLTEIDDIIQSDLQWQIDELRTHAKALPSTDAKTIQTLQTLDKQATELNAPSPNTANICKKLKQLTTDHPELLTNMEDEHRFHRRTHEVERYLENPYYQIRCLLNECILSSGQQNNKEVLDITNELNNIRKDPINQGGFKAYETQLTALISHLNTLPSLSHQQKQQLKTATELIEQARQQREHTVVKLWIGANDMITTGFPVAESAFKAIDAVCEHTEQLIKLGYTHIEWKTLPDLAITPRYHLGDYAEPQAISDSQQAHHGTVLFNQYLRHQRNELQAKHTELNLQIIDVNEVLDECLTLPEQSGFSKQYEWLPLDQLPKKNKAVAKNKFYFDVNVGLGDSNPSAITYTVLDPLNQLRKEQTITADYFQQPDCAEQCDEADHCFALFFREWLAEGNQLSAIITDANKPLFFAALCKPAAQRDDVEQAHVKQMRECLLPHCLESINADNKKLSDLARRVIINIAAARGDTIGDQHMHTPLISTAAFQRYAQELQLVDRQIDQTGLGGLGVNGYPFDDDVHPSSDTAAIQLAEQELQQADQHYHLMLNHNKKGGKDLPDVHPKNKAHHNTSIVIDENTLIKAFKIRYAAEAERYQRLQRLSFFSNSESATALDNINALKDIFGLLKQDQSGIVKQVLLTLKWIEFDAVGNLSLTTLAQNCSIGDVLQKAFHQACYSQDDQQPVNTI